MNYSDGQIWLIIVLMGIGTFLIRYSFLGLVGKRQMPDWVLRHLRYSMVAILPGLVAPLVIWSDASGSQPDLIRIAAAVVAVAIGVWLKGPVRAIIAGLIVFYGLGVIFG